MNHIIRDRLWYLMVLFSIFATIPQIIRFNFFGAVFAEKLSFFPLLAGLLLTLYYEKCHVFKTSLSRRIGIYLLIYAVVLFISLIHELVIYPYYGDILNGPISQVDKIPVMQAFLQRFGFDVSETTLLSIWMFARPLKGLFVTTFWTFGCSYLIYYWYRKDSSRGLNIMRKGAVVGAIIICAYGVLDVWYLSGSHTAEYILTELNPIVHEIKSNGTWWPPLLWKGQLRSLFAEPSYFGIWCAFAMPWLWYTFATVKRTTAKVGVLSLAFVITVFLFLTNARTANVLIIGEVVLLFAASVAYRAYLLKKALIIMLCIACAFGVAVVAGGFLPGSPVAMKQQKPAIVNNSSNVGKSLQESTKLAQKYVKNNVTSVVGDNKRSNGARYSVLEANIKIGMDHPLLGVGTSLRSAYIPNYLPQKAFSNGEVKMWLRNQKEKGILKSGIPALGEYSSRFAETGFVGLGIFMVPPLFLLLKLLKRIKSDTTAFEEKLGYIFFTISFCGILASGMGDSLNITCCYWLLLGLGYAIIFGETEKKKL